MFGPLSREMGRWTTATTSSYFGAEAAHPPRPGMEPELHLIMRGEYGGGNLRPHGGGGPVCGPAHPTALDQGLPVQGERTDSPACGAGGISSFSCGPPGASWRLYTAASRRENIPCTSGESQAFFSTLECGGDGSSFFVDHRQSAAGYCRDHCSAAVAAVRLSPDRLAQIRALLPEETTMTPWPGRHEDTGLRQTLDGLRLAARDMTADRLLWKLYTQCHAMAVLRGHGGGGAARKENLIALYTYAGSRRRQGRGGLFDSRDPPTTCWRKDVSRLSPPRPPAAACRSRASIGPRDWSSQW